MIFLADNKDDLFSLLCALFAQNSFFQYTSFLSKKKKKIISSHLYSGYSLKS